MGSFLSCYYKSVSNFMKLWKLWRVVFKFSQTNTKTFSKIQRIPNLCLLFLHGIWGCWVINSFVIFHKIKVCKHIWSQCCLQTAETGSWFILIIKSSYSSYKMSTAIILYLTNIDSNNFRKKHKQNWLAQLTLKHH